MSQAVASKPVPRRSPSPPAPPTQPPKNSDWSNRKTAFFGAAIAIAIFGGGYLLTRPTYVPSTIFQPKNGDRPQAISDLTPDSKTCDAAVRSMLLAFANEIDEKGAAEKTDAIAKTKSLVENDLAIVPLACQKLIDPRSLASIGNVDVAVQSLRKQDYKLSAVLTVKNNGVAPIFVGFEDSDRNVGFSDDGDAYEAYQHFDVRGVYNCAIPCGTEKSNNFTRIDPSASAVVTVEALKFATYYRTPKLGSLALTLLSAAEGGKTESLSFGFHNVEIGR